MKASARISRIALWLFLLTAAALSAYRWMVRPLVGDDIFYALDLRQRGGSLPDLPGQMAAVWMGCNARMGDIVNTVWLEMLPSWVGASLCFASAIALPLIVIRLGGARRRILLSALLTAATVWLLPWWDMSHLVCIINYPWGAVLALACLIPLLSDRIKSQWWLAGLPVAFFAGAYHEALGFPIAAGLAVWIVVNHSRIHLSKTAKLWVAALILGGMFTLTSPSIWNRLGAHEASASVGQILLSSANLTLLMVAVILLITIFNRLLIKRLLFDSFLMLAIAALASAAICAVSGIEGRSGFFSQLFAMAALSRIYVVSGVSVSVNPWIKTILASVIYLAATAQVVAFYIEDREVTKTLRAAYDLYPSDPEGAYRAVMSLQEFDEWDAASLKCLDPAYDRMIDRDTTFPLNHD